jgi:hypothetical protein
MNIDPLSDRSELFASFRRHGAFNEDLDPARAGTNWDQFSADRSATVRDTLAALPEIRPEVVARGRQLLADPNYPGPAVVAKIASLITPLPED